MPPKDCYGSNRYVLCSQRAVRSSRRRWPSIVNPCPIKAALNGENAVDSIDTGCQTGWTFDAGVASVTDEQDFLSRCDEQGRQFFADLLNAQKATSTRTRVTWDHESGFLLKFHFPHGGFVPVCWGFPSKSRDGKSIKQRLDFPFDFSLKAGVPEKFLNELPTSLSALVTLSGGRKRPSIAIAGLSSSEMARIIQTIFGFVDKASEY